MFLDARRGWLPTGAIMAANYARLESDEDSGSGRREAKLHESGADNRGAEKTAGHRPRFGIAAGAYRAALRRADVARFFQRPGAAAARCRSRSRFGHPRRTDRPRDDRVRGAAAGTQT